MKRRFVMYVPMTVLVLGSYFIGGPEVLLASSESIQAAHQPELTYEIESTTITSDEGGIIYKEKLYVSIEEIAKLFNRNISYENHKLTISPPGKDRIVTVENEDLQYNHNARVMKVDYEHGEITIIPEGEENLAKNYRVFEITQETKIQHTLLERIFPLEVLKEGMYVSIGYREENSSGELNRCVTTVEIVSSGDAEQLLPTIEDVRIIAINKEKEYITVAYRNKLQEQLENQIIVHVDHHTNLRDCAGNSNYTIDCLKVGQDVNIVTNGIMTSSIPVQTLGLEIIFMLTPNTISSK